MEKKLLPNESDDDKEAEEEVEASVWYTPCDSYKTVWL